MEAGIASVILAAVLLGLCIGVALNGVLATQALHLSPFVAVWPALLAFGAALFLSNSLYNYADIHLSLWKALALFFTLQVLFQFLALRPLTSTARRIGASIGLAVVPWVAVVASPFILNMVRSAHAAP